VTILLPIHSHLNEWVSDMLVEFCAPPGSGKTTVARAWSNAVQKSGATIHHAKDLPFLARKMLVARTSLRKGRALPEDSLERYCDSHCSADRDGYRHKLIKDLAQFAYWRDKRPLGAVLFDESICQQFLLLCMRSNTSPASMVETYLRLMPRMDVVVTLAVPPEQSFTRIWQRNPHDPYFFGGKSRDETLWLLQAANKARDLLLEGAERRGITVIRCDGLLAPDENVRRITEVIQPQSIQPRTGRVALRSKALHAQICLTGVAHSPALLAALM
jgi:hypothetical protein